MRVFTVVNKIDDDQLSAAGQADLSQSMHGSSQSAARCLDVD